MKIAIINGPNLNRLGLRAPDLYGSLTMEKILADLRREFPELEILYFQSNSEGDIIDELQRLSDRPDCAGIIINPGAYAHYSYAIADALRDIPTRIPTMEIHISNILAREEFRGHSVTAEAVTAGVISGCGTDGYRLAILNIRHRLESAHNTPVGTDTDGSSSPDKKD